MNICKPIAMSKNILITGGSGLLGKQLTSALLKAGNQVTHLSRKPGKPGAVKTFLWDIENSQIDPACIEGIDIIVHLAGEGIVEKRWTEERKKALVESRTKSIELIYGVLKRKPHTVKRIISASATGYYSDRGDELLTEESQPAHDFLGNCCIDWERAVGEGKQLGLQITKFRTGVVLTKDGGALPQLALPVKFGIGSPIGSGNQWVPWIHYQDVTDMYLWAINNDEVAGVYNMVAPNPVTNKQLTQAVALQFNKSTWLPNVPAFILKLWFGELSQVVLGSTKASAFKVERAGYIFKYPVLEDALKEIYST
jgi:uncharacterized protein (TIGR01777 family)